MSPIDLGIGFEEMEKLARPPLIPDGTYEFVVAKIEDSPVQQSGRPQWRCQLTIINRPDLVNRSVFYYCQLPWIDPDSKQWDYSNTFGLVNFVNGTGMEIHGKSIPDKEAFQGRTGVMKVGHRTRKGTETDPEPTIDQSVAIVTKRKGGGVVG